MEYYGVVQGFEKSNTDRIVVSPTHILGNHFVPVDDFCEPEEDISPGAEVYDCGNGLLTIEAYCEECGNEKFVLDNGGTCCAICDNRL